MPHSKVPAGGRDVRLHLHDSSYDHRPVPRGLQTHGFLLEGLLQEVPLHRRSVADLPRLQLPAALHLLSAGGGEEPVRLLGDVCRTVGEPDLHQLDHPVGVCSARGHFALLPNKNMHDGLLQHEEEGAAGRTLGHDEGGVQRQDEDREDDFCDHNDIHGVLEPVLRGPVVVCVESKQCAN